MIYLQLCVLLVLCGFSAMVTHEIDNSKYQKLIAVEQQKSAQAQKDALDHENMVIFHQAQIAQTKQKEKDDLQAQYDSVISKYRGMLGKPNTSGSAMPSSSSAAIPAQGLRLLEQDVESLINFARDCSTSEIERNEVIQKYNALSVK